MIPDYLKWPSIIALALLLFVGGRSCGVNAGNKALASCSTDRGAAVQAKNDAARALQVANRETALAEIAAAEQAKRAEVAIRQAGEAREQYAASLQGIEDALLAGMKNPTCRARLEEQVCVPLL